MEHTTNIWGFGTMIRFAAEANERVLAAKAPAAMVAPGEVQPRDEETLDSLAFVAGGSETVNQARAPKARGARKTKAKAPSPGDQLDLNP